MQTTARQRALFFGAIFCIVNSVVAFTPVPPPAGFFRGARQRFGTTDSPASRTRKSALFSDKSEEFRAASYERMSHMYQPRVNAKTRSIPLIASLLGAISVTNPVAFLGFTTAAVASASFLMLEVVTTGNQVLVERFGKYHRQLGPGWHFLARPVDSVSFRGTTREQLLDVPPQQCYTLDNAPIKADAVVYLRIFDVKLARYAVDQLLMALHNLCLTQLREQVGKLTLDESFASRDRINKALLQDLNAVVMSWGVEITRVEIRDLQPSPDILTAMELQMGAERRKRATILESEGERATLINKAEGRATAVVAEAKAEKESIELLATAEAEKIRIEADGLKLAIQSIASATGTGKDSMDAALQILMLTRYMETQAKFADSDGTKLLMFPTKDR